MTTDDAPGPGAAPADEALQFDHADFTAAPAFLICGGCGQPIRDAYYEIQGKVYCGRCRDQVVNRFGGRSGPAHYARGGLFGLAAALAGASLFLVVLQLVGYPISLLYVVIGYMVGMAVRKGAGYRGGLPYQVLAILLTYAGVVACFVLLMVSSMMKKGLPIGPNLWPVLKLACIAPVVVGTKSITGLIIIGFALLQAWRLTKKLQLPISGPFQVSGGGPSLREAPAHA
jgi:hypothetical protein